MQRPLAHDRKFLGNDDNVDFTGLRWVLVAHSDCLVCLVKARCHLTLAQRGRDGPDLELSYDFLTCEPLGKVEDFDRVLEDDDDPLCEHHQVHDLHLRAELD